MSSTTTLAVIGDVHARWSYLGAVIERIAAIGVDGVLLVGDLGSNDLWLTRQRNPTRDARWLESVREVLARVATLDVPVAYVPGNHDLPGLDLPGNVDGGVVTIGGLRVAGIGGAGPDRYGFPYEWDEADVRRRVVPPCDVLLVHAPPRDTPLDAVGGRSAGSAALRERALAHTGFLVCGHIHEAPGAIQLGDCLCMNAGGLGEPYGRPQVAFLRRGPDGDEAWHEDLASGEVRRWQRTPTR